MQIIDDTNAGGRLGAALGSGLNQLAQNKLAQVMKQYDQQYERSQYAKGLAPLLGPDTANFLSNLNPEERKYALQNIGSLMQLQQNVGEDQSGLNALKQPSQGQQFGQNPRDVLGAIANMIGKTPEQAWVEIQKDPELQRVFVEGVGLQGPQKQQPLQAQQPQERIDNKQQQIPKERAKLIEDIFTSPQEKREREKLELAKKQTNLKETKKYVETLKDQEKAAKESDLRLNRMKTLIEKGNLPNANLWSFLTKIEDLGPLATGGAGALIGSVAPGVGTAVGAAAGGVLGALSGPLAGAAKSFIKTGSPDIEEFEKLSADFVKNAKQYFGSRLTDADLRVFMQTLPTLMQTDAGKKKVIENLSALNELSQIESKAARSIIAENGGIPPLDIEQQVKDKISDKIDKVAKRFIGQ